MPETIGRRILVACNNSAETARAVRAGLDFMADAEEIALLTVAEEGVDSGGASALQGYLDAYGLQSTVLAVPLGDGPVAATILDRAEDRAADLLIMGAYGHSRLREMVLGGVTRDILANPALPVLMQH